MNKSFQLIRTNPALTTNVKLVVDSDYKLYLESFNSNPDLSLDRFKHFSVNEDSSIGDSLSVFYKGVDKSIAYSVKKYDDSTFTHNKFNMQFSDDYNSGVSATEDTWYKEEFEYFAPLHIYKNHIPKYFVIFRNDGNKVNSELDFNTDVVDKMKLVKIFDLTEKSPLGIFLKRNINDNNLFPEFPLDINYDDNIPCKWNGYDYSTGSITSKSFFMEKYYQQHRRFYEFDKIITDNYKDLGVIYPNIINFKFLFDDVPAKVNGDKSTILSYSINNYVGFYLDDIEFLHKETEDLATSINDNPLLEIQNSIFGTETNNIFTSINPFKVKWSDNNSNLVYVNDLKKYCKVERIVTENGFIYKIISDKPINSDGTNNISIALLDNKINTIESIKLNYIDGKSYFNKGDNSGISNNGSFEILLSESDNTINDRLILPIFDFDLIICSINEKYYKVGKEFIGINQGNKKPQFKIFINSDEKIELFNNTLKITKYDGNVTYKTDFKNLIPFEISFYACSFIEVKDFDFDIIETNYSKYEYETSNERIDSIDSKDHKFYVLENVNSESIRVEENYTHVGIDYRNLIIPVSSEYVSDKELFIEESDIISKNQYVCKWEFKGSDNYMSNGYRLNNSLINDEFNKSSRITTNINNGISPFYLSLIPINSNIYDVSFFNYMQDEYYDYFSSLHFKELFDINKYINNYSFPDVDKSLNYLHDNSDVDYFTSYFDDFYLTNLKPNDNLFNIHAVVSDDSETTNLTALYDDLFFLISETPSGIFTSYPNYIAYWNGTIFTFEKVTKDGFGNLNTFDIVYDISTRRLLKYNIELDKWSETGDFTRLKRYSTFNYINQLNTPMTLFKGFKLALYDNNFGLNEKTTKPSNKMLLVDSIIDYKFSMIFQESTLNDLLLGGGQEEFRNFDEIKNKNLTSGDDESNFNKGCIIMYIDHDNRNILVKLSVLLDVDSYVVISLYDENDEMLFRKPLKECSFNEIMTTDSKIEVYNGTTLKQSYSTIEFIDNFIGTLQTMKSDYYGGGVYVFERRNGKFDIIENKYVFKIGDDSQINITNDSFMYEAIDINTDLLINNVKYSVVTNIPVPSVDESINEI